MEMNLQFQGSGGISQRGRSAVLPVGSFRTLGLATLLMGGFAATGTEMAGVACSRSLGMPTTCSAIVIQPAQMIRPKTTMAARLVSEQASLVVDGLGLNKSQVAEILGVSRPTVYAWLDGSTSQLQEPKAGKLQMLSQLAADIRQPTNRPLFHGYVTRPMDRETQSILDLLLKPKWNEPELARLFAKARTLTTERDIRLEKLQPQILPSKGQQRKNLEDNLAALGAKN